jgi:subtilisin family serine protease
LVRVAILDSGVHAGHPHLGNVLGGIGITREGPTDDYSDSLGHGTAVAAAIHEKAPAAGLLIVKIFHRQLAATIEQLIAGLEWAIEQRVDFINLSLGTRNQEHCARFEPLIQRAVTAGIRIVSARHINGSPCYPGSMPGVLGVDSDATVPRDEVRYQGETAIASPYPRPIPGVPPERNLNGISFAVANATGLLCAQAINAILPTPEQKTP